MLEILRSNGFDVIEINEVLRVFYEKGKAYETHKKIKSLLPEVCPEDIKVFYGMIEIEKVK